MAKVDIKKAAEKALKRLNAPKSSGKKIGKLIDEIYRLEVKKTRAEAGVSKIKKEIQKLEDRIFKAFNTQDIDGAKGSKALAVISRRDIPQVKDWRKFFTYVQKHKADDLLAKRINSIAWRERVDAKEYVPGIEVFTKISLSVRKR